jgi:adenylylsulfate kinase
VQVPDGANLRLGISDNLGFQALERGEAVRRAAHVARLMNDAGVITVVALVSPFAADRDAARDIIGKDRFVEVYLSAPVEACESRDEENLYARARAGSLPRFTGVSAPYEIPKDPALVLPTHELAVGETVEQLLKLVLDRIRV